LEVSVYPIPDKDFTRPGDRAGRADACWLRPCPGFKVRRAIVVLHAIAVIDRLLGEHVAAE
jgi:hypothetical protein